MSDLFTWQSLLALILGGLYGAVFGAIPGLTATLAVALFIPFAFFLDPNIALPAIISIASVAIYAGDVGSAVAKIPGTPASAAYLEELFTISRKKGPVFGLGISALGSAFGGIVGTVFLMLGATGIASLAKNFSSFEYFWIAILGLCAGIFAASGSTLKAFVSLLIGLGFATIGVDPTLGYGRFHFDNPNLFGGLNYIVAMIGLFGFSEVLEHLFYVNKQVEIPQQKQQSGVQQFFMIPFQLIKRKVGLVLRSAFVGVFVGFLPGAGADIGAWVASSIQKIRRGKGSKEEQTEEIVLAGASSNNASVAGAWIPALSLGLPGDTITAIVLGIFMMKGISPGPMLFDQQGGLLFSLYLAFLLSNLFLLPAFGYLVARIAALLTKIPFKVLLTIIAGLCIVGAYAIQNNPFDVWVMIAMGFFAFLLKRGGFPLAQVVLGMVLGPILESNFMVSAIKSSWDMSSFFQRPIAIGLMVATLGIIIAGFWVKRSWKQENPQ